VSGIQTHFEKDGFPAKPKMKAVISADVLVHVKAKMKALLQL